MKRCCRLFLFTSLCLATCLANAQHADSMYRPQVHFSPKAHWTNDPNGMVYNNGVYHLFFQYHPNSSVWGPMHWGHATSTDLFHWKEQKIALYPDSLGMIFSGSAVADVHNTSGFGRNGKTPLVAIFTQHNDEAAKAGRKDFQNQSIAYSLDNGNTWIKYSGNPVVKNPGLQDFRDPKVSWNEATKKWIMTLAAGDRIMFFSSPDLKNWTKESEFGEKAGAHGGVWECPDLFTLKNGAKTVWTLIVNINPGGPNGGSATQYFLGNFDGHKFIASDSIIRWMDYGPDEYAGITWSNTGDRRIFLGWMSNWTYATQVPTETWRNAMTIPRDLSLIKDARGEHIASLPVKPYLSGGTAVASLQQFRAGDLAKHKKAAMLPRYPFRLTLRMDTLKDFALHFSNEKGEEIIAGYQQSTNRYYIDRTHSGLSGFSKAFSAVHTAPRFSVKPAADLILIVDRASVELFADDGRTVMTAIFFPTSPYSKLSMESAAKTVFKSVEISKW